MIEIKEAFVGCDKYVRALALGGSDAIVLWLAMKGYASEHLTDGFVSFEDFDVLRGAPKNRRKAVEALIGCGRMGPDGERGAGLVDRGTKGYQLHDYLDHALSRERVLAERAAAKERKRRWSENGNRTQSERRSERRTERPSQPNPTQPKEEDPPTPLPPRSDPFGASFAQLREDVLRLHEAYRTTFGLTNHKLKNSSDSNALILAEALDQHGEQACMLVLKHARSDGMVNGKADEKQQKHEKIAYIFGNADTFARILRDANEREGKSTGRRSALDVVREAREL